MDLHTTLTWLVRYGHVVFAAGWLGGYAALALAVIPLLERDRSAGLARLAVGAARTLTYVGAVTMFFGVFLITRTRGLANLIGGEWGTLVIAGIVIAVALVGIGDGPLRQGLVTLVDTGDGTAARRWALAGFVLTVLAIGLMTRAVYAST
jgi:hypothetical protein